MTLENQVATLVSSTNELTETVKGKVGEIDAAVVSMQNSVGQFLADQGGTNTIIVDQVSGNDASADVSGATVRTVAEALRRVKPFQTNLIRLKANQTHVFDQSVSTAVDSNQAGLDQGYILFQDADQVASGSPNSASPVLVWKAQLTTGMNVILGHISGPLNIRHQGGGLTSGNPQSPLGTGQPVFAITTLSYSHLYLEVANSPFIQRAGHLSMFYVAVFQQAAGGRVVTNTPELFSIFKSECVLLGDQNPRRWDQVLNDRALVTSSDLEDRVAKAGEITIHANTDNGDDNADGLTAATAVRSASRVAQLLAKYSAVRQYLRISGTADFVVDNNIAFQGHLNEVDMADLTGSLVFEAETTSNDGVVVGDTIRGFIFQGVNNYVRRAFHAGTPRLPVVLPNKSGFSGEGNEWFYNQYQGAFRMGEVWTTNAHHLSILGAEFTIGENQTLVARASGLNPYAQTPQKLVVSFVDCGFTLADETTSQKLSGVVEATGTITDNYT